MKLASTPDLAPTTKKLRAKDRPLIYDFVSDEEFNNEICFYGWRDGAGHRFFGPDNVSDIWAVKKVHGTHMVHLTEKPVELAARAIGYSSKPGENVLELFGGSGSTLIACEQTGRRCFAMELDALYCDVIKQRWEEFTGKEAVLVSREEGLGTREEGEE